MNNKTNCLAAILLAIFALTVNAEKIGLVNGTLINPGSSQIVQNATIVIDGDRIAAAGDAKALGPAAGGKNARIIDCKDKFILPAYCFLILTTDCRVFFAFLFLPFAEL
jgi:adenine deaminase